MFGVAIEQLLTTLAILQEPVALKLFQRLRHGHIHTVEPIYGEILTHRTKLARVPTLIVLKVARACIVFSHTGQLIIPVQLLHRACFCVPLKVSARKIVPQSVVELQYLRPILGLHLDELRIFASWGKFSAIANDVTGAAGYHWAEVFGGSAVIERQATAGSSGKK